MTTTINESSSEKKESDAILPKKSSHGLGLVGAAMFIVGEIAGTGVLALPDSVQQSGWIGIFSIVFCCIVAAISGVYLGDSWIILEERWPEYRGKVRSPFSTIALRAVGPKMQTLATASMNIQLFGGTIVMLLLCSEMVSSLTNSFIHIKFCDWIIIIGLILLPLTFFGSPADFWPVAVIAMGGTAVSSVLITVGSSMNVDTSAAGATSWAPASASTFFLSLGTVLFAVSGAAALPTFQNDMKDKSKFSLACYLGFALMCAMYLTVSISGYYAFGTKVETSIIRNLPPGTISTFVNICMVGHVFCAFLIVINPVNLSLEDYFGIPHSFNWKRCAFRAVMVMTSIFLGSTVPKFGKILNLIGGSTVPLQSFIMPPLFYICLCRQSGETWSPRKVSTSTYVIAGAMAIIGSVAGVVSTWSALSDIIDPKAFTPPCYVDACAAFTSDIANQTSC